MSNITVLLFSLAFVFFRVYLIKKFFFPGHECFLSIRINFFDTSDERNVILFLRYLTVSPNTSWIIQTDEWKWSFTFKTSNNQCYYTSNQIFFGFYSICKTYKQWICYLTFKMISQPIFHHILYLNLVQYDFCIILNWIKCKLSLTVITRRHYLHLKLIFFLFNSWVLKLIPDCSGVSTRFNFCNILFFINFICSFIKGFSIKLKFNFLLITLPSKCSEQTSELHVSKVIFVWQTKSM